MVPEGPVGSEIQWWVKNLQNRVQAALFEEQFPILTYQSVKERKSENGGIREGLGKLSFKSIPLFTYLERQDTAYGAVSADPAYDKYLEEKDFKDSYGYLLAEKASEGEVPEHELVKTEEEIDAVQQAQASAEVENAPGIKETGSAAAVAGTQYSLDKLSDFDFLLNTFYSVHSSTTINSEALNAKKLLEKDLRMAGSNSQPQILIYHTHSQEEFTDFASGNQDATVVGVGTYLTELLSEKYGYQVIHDTSVYDLVDGQLDRNKAYTYALEGITKILEENPSIEVVLDIHRDGVREDLHLVSEVNGKPTAKIMLFNGLSQTVSGRIEYLNNPYREDNLAFSLQLQLKAAASYPNFTRKIYLKGLRYNQHLRPKSVLVEVGAQTNSYEEARNAMEPLADMLHQVLQ